MTAYLNLFSPNTHEAFTQSPQTISGFRIRHQNAAQKIKPGSHLLCYLTKLSRWIGLLAAQIIPKIVVSSPCGKT